MSTAIPVVFIHGLWLHASSWQAWADRFAARGYAPSTPGWPGEPGTVAAALGHEWPNVQRTASEPLSKGPVAVLRSWQDGAACATTTR